MVSLNLLLLRPSLRSSRVSTDTPTFRVIKPAAKEALSEWYPFSYPCLQTICMTRIASSVYIQIAGYSSWLHKGGHAHLSCQIVWLSLRLTNSFSYKQI